MLTATMTETTARPGAQALHSALAFSGATGFTELIRFVNRHTLQQIRDLAIHQRGDRLVVTGRAETYYAKQLVTQAIQTAAPAVRLANEVSVG